MPRTKRIGSTGETSVELGLNRLILKRLHGMFAGLSAPAHRLHDPGGLEVALNCLLEAHRGFEYGMSVLEP